MVKESDAARAVAQDVIKSVVKGEIPHKGKIAKKHGYSDASVSSSKALHTKTYKRIMQPYVERLEKERLRIMKAMEEKDLTDEDYKVLVDASVKVTHDIQLLSGGKTENVGIEEDRSKLKEVISEMRDDKNHG